MRYEIRLSAPCGDVVPLVAVADAKAGFRATAGGTDFHRPAYKGSFKQFADDLLREARSGKLKVCTCWGVPGAADALIAEAERTGDLMTVSRYLVEPDWERLYRENPPVAPGVWNLSHLDLGPSEVDWNRTHLGALHTTLKWLNEWAASRADEFTVTHEDVEWADERGIHRPTGKWATSKPASVVDTLPKPSERAPVPDEVPAKRDWPLRKPRRDDGLAGPIYRVLNLAHLGNAARPTASDVLESFRETKPTEVIRVLADGCDYFDRRGNEASANLEQIRKRIATMTAKQAPSKAG